MGCAASTPVGEEQVTLGMARAPPQEQAGASPLKLEDESTPCQGTVELNPTFEDLHERASQGVSSPSRSCAPSLWGS